MTRSRRDAGFTLIEIAVALALTALVSLTLLHGVRLAATGLDRHTRQADRLDARHSLDDILRRVLGSAAAVPQNAGGAFTGQPDRIEFLSVAEDSGAGLYRIDIGVDRSRDGHPLTLRRRLAAATGDPRVATSILATHVRSLRLAYFGANGSGSSPAWHEHWEALTTLPSLVRVILDTGDDAPSPPLIVRLWDAG
jgi:prepilin-type N-terminal cleavage/methylation domain-containing protein